MVRTGAQLLWESLVRHGVTTVFGYPGGAILPAYDAMLDYPIHHGQRGISEARSRYGNQYGFFSGTKSMWTCFVSRNASSPSSPSSRPMPLFRMPPNGAASLSVSGSLIQKVPALISVIACMAHVR